MEPTKDMMAILNCLKDIGGQATAEAISFCTGIVQWRIDIDLDDMADEGWLVISTNEDGWTVATITDADNIFDLSGVD